MLFACLNPLALCVLCIAVMSDADRLLNASTMRIAQKERMSLNFEVRWVIHCSIRQCAAIGLV